MSRFEDERWPERGAGDRGGAAAHSRDQRHEGSRGPDRGLGSRRSAHDYDTTASEYEGGYGGGRERGENWPEHGFGDRGWGGGRGSGMTARRDDRGRHDLPEGAHPVPDGPQWQERYTRENADKYGQWGGQPITGRGSSQSLGGYDHRESGLGNTNQLSSRGGMGLRETDTIETGHRGHAGRGPKNYRRSDEQICEEVNRRLTEHPDLDATEIEVHVKDGEVTLSGHVDDRHWKYLAEDLAYEVPGTREVHNRIRLMSRERTGIEAREPATRS